MRHARALIVLMCIASSLFCQQNPEGPNSPKAQKAYKQALDYLHNHMIGTAVGSFRKADKEDGGTCLACQRQIVKYAVQIADWKSAEAAATEMVSAAKDNKETALCHYQLGWVLMEQAIAKHKQDLFTSTHEEMLKALSAYSNFPEAVFLDGRALAFLNQDDAAKARFGQFVKMSRDDDVNRRRAQRYLEQPELARARMAPAFEIVTTDGQTISLDALKGKVVLIDFWATWCAPCREALPHMRDIARKFQGEPLIVLSVSLDEDEQKWKTFVEKNGMTWPQYRDTRSDDALAKIFSVNAIPHTFTIDSDGVLQDEHIGDASIEGKLKKLLARARQLQVAEKTAQ